MKKILLFILACVTLTKSYGQYNPGYDTLRRNEISVNVLPIIGIFSGFNISENRYATYNFGYKHYFKNRTVLRAGIGTAPEYYLTGGVNGERYVRTIDTLNIFSNYSNRMAQRVELSLGFEKIFKVKRFMHGVGAELVFSHHIYDVQQNAYWYPTRLSGNDKERYERYYSYNNTYSGKIYNGVDSLKYSYISRYKGIGLRAFYSLRYKINKYLYITSTAGPYIMISQVTYEKRKGVIPSYARGSSVNMDFTLLISDVSLAFRF